MAEHRGKEILREAETKDVGWKMWRRQWGGGGKREAWNMIASFRDRGVATTHRLKAPVWPEEEGSQEGGGQSTKEYGGRNVPKA